MPRTGTEQPQPRLAARHVELGREAAAGPGPAADRTIRIVAADGHPVVLAGLSRLCDRSTWLRLAAPAGTGAEAVAAVREHRPDLVVMETRFPDLAAIDLIRQLRAIDPGLPLVLFTADAARAAHTAAADAAVVAVVHKRSDLADLEGVLRRVISGERLMPERDAADSRRSGRGPGGLTSREHEILQKVAAGMTNVEIAQELGLTHNTIKTYFQRTLEKLGARNRVEALLRADEKGLL